MTAVMAAFALMSNNAGPGSAGSGNLTTTGCVNCHGPNNANTKVSLGLTDDVTGTPVTTTEYVPGRTYTVTELGTNATASQTHFGFQVMAVNGAGNQAGSFTIVNAAVAQTLTAGSLTGVEHKTKIAKSGNSCNPQLKWTAPAAGAGAVSFRIALNVVNNNSTTSGDQANVGTITLQEKSSASVPGVQIAGMRLFPNPSHGNMTLDLGTAPEGLYTMKVIDVSGKTAVTSEFRSSGAGRRFNVPAAELKAGLYHLVISGPQVVQVLKFIRQ